jgi:hypothetical protein
MKSRLQTADLIDVLQNLLMNIEEDLPRKDMSIDLINAIKKADEFIQIFAHETVEANDDID